MKTINKKKAIPKYFWGALLSSGVGLVTSAIGANKAEKARKLAEQKALRSNYKEELNNDNFEAEQYQEDIANGISGYYKSGGKLALPPVSSTKGGVLKPISSDMVIAKGNKHEESKIDNTSGIKLLKNGKAVAEIEDNETIKNGRMVYSDRLTIDGKESIANKAKKLAMQKGLAERKQDNTKVNTLDKMEDKLFKIQENIKNNSTYGDGQTVKEVNNKKQFLTDMIKKDEYYLNMVKGNVSSETLKNFHKGNAKVEKRKKELNSLDSLSKTPTKKNFKTAIPPEFKKGGFLDNLFGKLNEGQSRGNQIGQAITPFIDNIGNAILTSKTPKIAAPVLERVKNYKTKVNANPQLASIDNSVASTTEFIKNNTSNSNIARSNVASAKLQGANAKATVLANKENQETQLYNTNQDRAQMVQARNTAKIDANNMQQTMRADDMASRTSANLANLAGDFVDKKNFDAVSRYQDRQLDALEQTGDGGVSRRLQLNDKYKIEEFKKDPKTYYAKFKGTPEEDAFLRIVGYNPFKADFKFADVKKSFNINKNNFSTLG